MERQWKLGEDLDVYDNVLDPIAFDEIILTLHCNEKVIDAAAVQRVMRELVDSRIEDMKYIFNKNIDEIIKRAKEGRE